MPALFVSGLLLLIVELILFALLWLQNPIITLCAVIAHFIIAAFAGLWFSTRWKGSTISTRSLGFFIACLVSLLPIVGSIILFLIDNHSKFREYGLNAGFGADLPVNEAAHDALNYFSAPNRHTEGSTRNTRGLLSSLDDDSYLGLLIASRHLPVKESYALLSEALLSPFESARLMAYSLRGKIEDKISESRQGKLALLKTSDNIQQKIELHLSLAHDYLHLIDVDMDSANEEELLKQSKNHCIAALKLNPRSSRGFKTLSRILKKQGKMDQAQQAEQHAFTLAST